MSRARDPGPSLQDLAESLELSGPPSRGNSGRDCTIVDEDRGLPEHIEPCTCGTHDGVCVECRFKITVGKNAEYGHRRATNSSADPDGVRRDCVHRPSSVNPGDRHEWEVGGDE